MNRFIAPILILFSLICSCKSDHAPSSTSSADIRGEIAAEQDCMVVRTIKVEEQPFKYDIVSTGKVESGEYVDLRFASSGAIIDRIMVRNGQRVSKGQVLAELDKFKLVNAISTASNSIERSRLDLADALIGPRV